MSELKCVACGGTYLPEVDGVLYFHACPKSVKAEDRRDENMVSTAQEHQRKIKAEGKGTKKKKA